MASPFQPISAQRYSQMANALYDALHAQGKVKSHSRNLFSGRFERCFRGSEGVATLRNLRFCSTAEEAVRFGNDLIEYGFITSVKGKGHRFKNKPASLYRFWRDGGAGKEGEVEVPGPSPSGARVTPLHADGMSMASTAGGSVRSYSEHEEDPAGSDRHIRDFTPDKKRGTPPSKRTEDAMAVASPPTISMVGIAQMHSRRSAAPSPAALDRRTQSGSGEHPTAQASPPSPLSAAPHRPAARPPTARMARSEQPSHPRGASGPTFAPRQSDTPQAPPSVSGHSAAPSGMSAITPPGALVIPNGRQQSDPTPLASGPASLAAGTPVLSTPATAATPAPGAGTGEGVKAVLRKVGQQMARQNEQLAALQTRFERREGGSNPTEGGLGVALTDFLHTELLTGGVHLSEQRHMGKARVFLVTLRLFLLFVFFLSSACSLVALPLLGVAGHLDAPLTVLLVLMVLAAPTWIATAFSSSSTLARFQQTHSATPVLSTEGVGSEAPPAVSPGGGSSSKLPELNVKQVLQEHRESAVRRRQH